MAIAAPKFLPLEFLILNRDTIRASHYVQWNLVKFPRFSSSDDRCPILKTFLSKNGIGLDVERDQIARSLSERFRLSASLIMPPAYGTPARAGSPRTPESPLKSVSITARRVRDSARSRNKHCTTLKGVLLCSIMSESSFRFLSFCSQLQAEVVSQMRTFRCIEVSQNTN